MPEKEKVMGNTEEEKDVQQITQAIGQFLKPYEVSVERGKNGYEDRYVLHLGDPADQKKYTLAYLFPKRDETTGESYYMMLLFLGVTIAAYIHKGFIPISRYHQKPGFFEALGFMDPIVKGIKGSLENFEITHSEVGEISFILHLKKQSPA